MDKIRLVLFLLIFLLACGTVCNATTKEELIIAINSTYYVAGKPYKLPEDIRIKGINYLRTHYFTEEDCTKIMGYINEAVDFANEVGTTDITKVSSTDIKKGMKIVSKAVAIADSAPTIEEMKAKELEKQKLLEQERQKQLEEERKKLEEEKVKNELKNSEKTNEEVKIDKNQSKPSIEENANKNIENIENQEVQKTVEPTVEKYDDEIDYSKYLSEEQFEDVEFEDLKKLVKKEVKKVSIKFILIFNAIIIIFVLIIIFLVVKLKRKLNNKKEEQ